MADQEEDELKMALRMSMQNSPPEPKRSKPRDAGAPAASPEDSRRIQRELMAAAAEKRMHATRIASPSPSLSHSPSPSKATVDRSSGKSADFVRKEVDFGAKEGSSGQELSSEEVNQLFSMVFGSGVSKDILAQWSNQGIRFSPDPETSMGLVQHEGGPCGVLATLQAFVLKYLLFFPNEIGKVTSNASQNLGPGRLSIGQYATSDNFDSLTEDAKARALVKSMGEILFMCGDNKRAVIATLNVVRLDTKGFANNEIVAKSLEGLSIESAFDLQKILRIDTHTSHASASQKLHKALPDFQSRMGALLFLISALLSRGLDSIQADRDDPSLPLVTAPFGHASQEIVNLLLCGQAVPNVFDGRMDLGGGMFLKGVFTSVEVGFLTLLESLNFCKVGQHLKCPKWPIWVVGSESHYTVLFALDTTAQDENELEERESQIRRAFDAQDQSGGGGFISVEGFHQVLREAGIRLPSEKLDHLCSTGFIVILNLDKSLGGLKDSSGLMGKKVFDLYHFNGIAKSDLNGSHTTYGGETPVQRPRLTKLRVSVPPRWTPEEFMADVVVTSGPGGNESSGKDTEVTKPEPAQHAPLVDCIRTRWSRAVCNWAGDPPSILNSALEQRKWAKGKEFLLESYQAHYTVPVRGLRLEKINPHKPSGRFVRVNLPIIVSLTPPNKESRELADEEPVDPKKYLEESCKPKCVKPLLEYQACVKRIQDDETGHKHCTGQYFDYWSCVDKCVALKLFSKLKADEELIDPKKYLEDSCKPKCVKPLLEYEACVKRVERDDSGHKHCTGQYFDYWFCIDKCVAPKLFSKLK
uniref:ubiquitinyl hydrolase 1 n=1 Tax=Salix viminalis TaxID=40686 RepID=A0A6N2KPB8_SALVM